MKINVKLLILVLEVSLIPLLFLGFVVYSNSKGEITKGAVSKLEAIAEIQKNIFLDRIAENTERLNLLKSRLQLRIETDNFNKTKSVDSQTKIRSILADAIVGIPSFKEISVLDPNGNVIASTNKKNEGSNLSSNSYFITGSNSDQVSDFIKNPEGSISLFLSGPLFLADKKIGVLVVTSDGSSIASVVSTYVGLGETGETQLVKGDVNGDALFLTPIRFDPLAAVTRTVSKTSPDVPSIHAIRGEEAIYLNVKDYKGTEVFAVTRYIPSVGWGIVVKIDTAEALSPVIRLQGLILFIFLISVLMILLISFSTSRSITDPIINLSMLANKIAEGDLLQKIQVTTDDEIGDLTIAFNRMAVNIGESYMTLEQKVNDRTIDLATAKAKDEAILADIGDGLAVADESGKLVYLNQIAIGMLGEIAKEDVPESWQEKFGMFNPVTFQALSIDEMPLVLAAKNQTTSKALIFIRSSKSPNGIFVNVTATPIMLAGKSVGAVAIFRDVTQEREIDRQKSEFISLASHQLRTPLGSMRWNLELLESQIKTMPKATQEALHQAYLTNLRVIRLVGDLLNIARIEQGRVQNEPEMTNAVEIIEKAVKEMEAEAKIRSVKLEISVIKKNIPKIMIDPVRFREVIQNLLSNAVKYTLPKGLVSVNVGSNNTSLLISVRDSGIGIPENEKSKIFTKFTRATNATRIDTEGSGLGLFIVKSFVGSWGGKIEFESKEGVGTTFNISLPLVVTSPVVNTIL